MAKHFSFPYYRAISNTGTPLAFAKLRFFLTGTSTPATVYADPARTTPLPDPVVSNLIGVFPSIYVDPDVVYRVRLTDSADVQQWQEDGVPLQLFPQTDGERLVPVTPVNYGRPATPIDVLRYGIVPNNPDPNVRSDNDAAIRALLTSDIAGPIGRLVFPPVAGTGTTYYFSDFFPSRDGILFDGMNCTIDFERTYLEGDGQTGFFYFVRNSGIENATINVNYDGSQGIHAGNVIRIGNRDNSGSYFHFGDEDTLGTPLGRITLRNLRITTNNPVNDGAILIFGGVRDLTCENVVINGSDACAYGILYEFGTYDSGETPDITAHASNLIFRNVRVSNLALTHMEGAGIALGAAYNVLIENLHVRNAYNVLSVRTGESLFYRVAPYDTIGAKRCAVMRNIVGEGISNNGIQLVGSELARGYLAGIINALPAGPWTAAQTDLGLFSLDGFALQCAGDGVKVSGAADIRNGVTIGCSSGISITDMCPRFNINNVEMRDSLVSGIRADFDDAKDPPGGIGPSRRKTGAIRNSKIVGSGDFGISLQNCEAVVIECNQIGYNTDYDPESEKTQGSGVTLGTNAIGVICRGNFVSTFGGAAAYRKVGAPAGCTYVSGSGTKTLAGLFHYGGPPIQSTLAFGASMTPDCTAGSEFVIAINSTAAFTINAPLNPMAGMRISFTIQNVSGAVAGAATWDATFKMASWTNPGNGKNRSIDFRYDGATWTEMSRTTADVPN